jgi:TIR domain
MASIFISCAKEDRGFVDRLASALTTAGHDVWFDRDLNVGPFRNQIIAKLVAADVVITVWSARSKESRYVLDESERAVSRGSLLPVRIDESALPLGFGEFQTFNLSTWSGASDHPSFTTLNNQVKRICADPHFPKARQAVKFVVKSLLLALLIALVCAPILVLLNSVTRAIPLASLEVASLIEAVFLSFICAAIVMLWSGYQAMRVGLSHWRVVSLRACRIYGLSTILGLIVLLVAVAAGVTRELPVTQALAQIGFVAVLISLTLGATISIVQAGFYFVRWLWK